MKKSTLFTTLALVVIVAVALSTATFAWYSASNTSVTADSLTVTAQAPSNADLRIKADTKPTADTNAGWANVGYTATLTADSGLMPATLVSEQNPTTITATSFEGVSSKQSGSQKIFSENGADLAITTISTSTIFVRNVSDAKDQPITVSVTGEGIGNTQDSVLYYAVVANNKIVATNAYYNAASAVSGNAIADYSRAATAVTVATDDAKVTITKATTVEFTLYVWINGHVYDEVSYADATIGSGWDNISVSFNAAA